MSQGEIYRINDAKLGDKPRSTFPLSTPHWFSMNFGRLYPIYSRLMEPGDTLSLDLKTVCRMATPIGPIMGSANLSYHAFWVPFRLVFTLAKQLFGENDETAWTRRSEIEVPYYKYSETFFFTNSEADEGYINAAGTDMVKVADLSSTVKVWVDLEKSFIYGANKLLDYLGEHPFVDLDNFPIDIFQKAINAGIAQSTISKTVVTGEVPAMLVRAVWLIWNEYYRDENYQDPFLFEKGLVPAGAELGSYQYPFTFPYGLVSTGQYTNPSTVGVNQCPIVCKKHDVLVNMLPEPQRGPMVNILAAAGLAPVQAGSEHLSNGDKAPALLFKSTAAGTSIISGAPSGNSVAGVSSGKMVQETGYNPVSGAALTPSNLWANVGQAAGLTLNAFRISVLTSQFYETLGIFGERYNEFIYGLFGVRVSDATIDRPEYLGGISIPIGTYQVPQTSAGSDGQTQLGDLGAFGYGDDKSSIIYKSFSEFGYVLVFASARIDHNYATLRAPETYWKNRLEFHYPLMDGMGMVPYLKKFYNPALDWKDSNGSPIFSSSAVDSGSKGDESVGFKEAWWNMRSKTPTVSGVFNPGNIFSLDYLTYIEKPTNDINQGPLFVSAFEEALIVDRTLQLGSLASIYGQQLLVMQMQDESLTRIIRVNSRPGLTRI